MADHESRPRRFAPRVAWAYLRSRSRSGWLRVRGAAIPNTQTAIFATLSWVICHHGLGEPNPIFAPIATFLCLGFSRNREPRKVLEIGIGATLGVMMGELVATLFGFGTWQILVLLLVTPLLARFIDDAEFLTFQTALNALVVGSMSFVAANSAEASTATGRWTDAVVGALIALVGAVILPTSLTSRPRRYLHSALQEIAHAMMSISDGIRDGNANAVRASFGSLAVARDQITEARAAHSSATDIAALNPTRRADRTDLRELSRLLRLADRLFSSVDMLGRQSGVIITESGPHPDVAQRTAQLAAATRVLASEIGQWRKPQQARTTASSLAEDLSPGEAHAVGGWRASVLYSQLRAITVDLLQLSGLSMTQARAQLPDVDRRTLAAETPPSEALPTEGGSDMWGTDSIPAIEDEPDDAGAPEHRD